MTRHWPGWPRGARQRSKAGAGRTAAGRRAPGRRSTALGAAPECPSENKLGCWQRIAVQLLLGAYASS